MKYDIIIVGSGPGGYVAAIRASQLGRKVALIEKAEAGGVCLNWGCIPTKALLKSAQIYLHCKAAENFGVTMQGEVQADLEKIVQRSRDVAETMSRGVQFLLKKNQIDFIQGKGTITAPHHIDVDGQDFKAEHIILATGASTREMPFMPIDGEHILSSRHALTLKKKPETMIVVGSGAIGSEFAWFYAALGVKVTIIEYLPHILPLEDEEVSKTIERSFRKMRVGVMTSTSVKNVRVNSEGKCEVEIESKKGEETLTADIVLSAVGIEPNTKGIGLEEVGIHTQRGKVLVDDFYRTNVEGIYAIGDIVAGPALAHVASAEAICCVEAICGLSPERIDYTTIPSCVFTSPEVASVGATEQQLIQEGKAYKVGRFPFTASGKATAAGERDGFVKLLFDEQTDALLGAHMIGAGTTEMIGEVALAKKRGITAHEIARTIHAHPTMNEAIMESAEAALGKAIHL